MAKKTKVWKKGLNSGNTMVKENLNDKVQKKAYELYKKRGYSHGNDWADWFEAERLVSSK